MAFPVTPEIVHAPQELVPDWMKIERTRTLTDPSIELAAQESTKQSGRFVAYWMQRDVRAVENWALLFASHLSSIRKVPLRVIYALPPPPSNEIAEDSPNHPPALIDMPMTARHGFFLLGGLEEVYEQLSKKNIPLHVVETESHEQVGKAVCSELLNQADAVVCDFSPLRQFREWMELQAAPILSKKGIPFYQVDTHNVVPVWAASQRREVGARTLRPRIHGVIESYLQDFPELPAQDAREISLPEFDKKKYAKLLKVDKSVRPVDWATPGNAAGMKKFQSFVENGLKHFDELRNDPNERNVCSNLSPWINHGHISFQRVVMDVKKLNKYANGTKAFIEEGVIRRELTDNYVFYAPNDYDSLSAAAGWAQETLQLHASDEREYVYTLEQLENGETHDDLWNAAQLQVVREGRMHGYLRMYWAKKILEWTESPEVALRSAQYLNDKYALDGRDPNGFVGVGWSIMGIHDQGFKERAVFGKIRFMNYAGCKRKFKIQSFVQRYEGAAENALQAAKGGKRQTTLDEAMKGAKKAKR